METHIICVLSQIVESVRELEFQESCNLRAAITLNQKGEKYLLV